MSKLQAILLVISVVHLAFSFGIALCKGLEGETPFPINTVGQLILNVFFFPWVIFWYMGYVVCAIGRGFKKLCQIELKDVRIGKPRRNINDT